MRVRSLLLDNLSWKLLSVTLALLIWSGARLFMHQDPRPLTNPLTPLSQSQKDFPSVPVRFLTRGSLQHPVRIEPETVLVRVGGEHSMLDRLTAQDAVVFVEVPADFGLVAMTNRVEVRLPPSIRMLTVIPERVVVTPGDRG